MKHNCPWNSPVLSTHACPFPGCLSQTQGPRSKRPARFGFYFRRDDSRRVQRFRCQSCLRTFSRATQSPTYRQRKRRINPKLYGYLSSEVSLRRCAYLAGVDRKTVARRIPFFGAQIRQAQEKQKVGQVQEVEFDELESIEHTKLKPLSVPLAVDTTTRRVIAFEVCQMPAKGLLAERSRRKYGPRPDERPKALRRLLDTVAKRCEGLKVVRSDSNPNYAEIVRSCLPGVTHEQVLSRRAASTGQGELKRGGFDPIFTLNHTCAMLRANISRLIRKTWCTTKRRDRLADHLAIYVHFHNEVVLKELSTGRRAS